MNNKKRAMIPVAWLAKLHPDSGDQRHYREKHLLGDLPAETSGLEAFHGARRERLRAKLTELLGTAQAGRELAKAF
jgi:hypothetical protein